METPIQGSQTPHSNSKRLMIPFSFMVGLASHVLMILPISMYGGFFHFSTIFTLTLAIFSFWISFNVNFFPRQQELEHQWYDSYRKLLEMQAYRQTCLRLYQVQGFSKWRWYIPHFVGPLGMIASTLVFVCMEPQRGALWILLAGVVGWCISFRWQIRRECRWCSEAGSIDLHFLYGRIFQLLIWYTIALYIFHTYGNGWEKEIQRVSIGILVLVHTCLSPNWIHLCLGQRRATSQKTFCGFLLEASCWYGNFGELSPSAPALSPSEKRRVQKDALLWDWVLPIVSSCILFTLYLVYIIVTEL